MFLSHTKRKLTLLHTYFYPCLSFSQTVKEEPEKFGDKSKGDSLKDENGDNEEGDDNSDVVAYDFFIRKMS